MTRAIAGLITICALGSCTSTRRGEETVATRAAADTSSPGTTTWEDRAPMPDAPLPRGNFATAYDEARGLTLVFGGQGVGGSTFADLRGWDGTHWASLVPLGAMPTGVIGATMAYDSARRRAVLFGGRPTNPSLPLAETWEWDDVGWTLASSAGPAPRVDPAMAYDPLRRVVVLFGGCEYWIRPCGSADTSLGDTWEWDGVAWKNPSLPASPPARPGGALAFDGARLVLYGGYYVKLGFPPAHLTDTWTYDGQTWSQANVALSPRGLVGPAAAYDPFRRRTIFYGAGVCGVCPLYYQTWEWDGASWEEESTSLVRGTDPSSYGLVFDTARRRAVLPWSDGRVTSLGLWEYYAYGNACTRGDACDTAQCNGGVCCLVACGQCQDCDVSGTRCVALRSKDDVDGCTGAHTCDQTATCKLKLGQPCAAPAECVSGYCAGGVCCGVETCAPFACGSSGACLASCAGPGDCAAGFDCRAGACVSPSQRCDGDTAVAVDGTRAACAPFGCGVSGCATTCATSDDCATGFSCASGGACVRTPSPAAIGGGCAIGGADARDRAPWALVLAALALTAARRRRAAPR